MKLVTLTLKLVSFVNPLCEKDSIDAGNSPAVSTSSGKKRSNMRDVARHAGVSVATVSRVLNGTAQVSQDTHERVSQAVQALQFVPSAAARAINSGRTHMVGALVPTLAHEIFASFLNEMEDNLSKAGLSLVVATTDYDREKEFSRAQGLLNLGVEALVVSGLDHADEFDDLISLYKVPVVSTSLFDASVDMPTIGYDNKAAAQAALFQLQELGHERIAVLSGPLANNDRTRERVRGLTERMPEIQVYEAGQSLEDAIELCTEITEQRPDVTALLCLSDIVAQGALIACKRNGVIVPKDMSVIGIDDLPSSAYTDPPLTSVHLPVRRMGLQTADAIIGVLEHGEPIAAFEIKSHVELRKSLARVRRK